MREIAANHIGESQRGFEWHGVEVWNGRGPWKERSPSERLVAYEEVLGLLEELDVWVGHSAIHKERLQQRYGDSLAQDAYLLALQYFVEKIECCHPFGVKKLRILIADEAKQHQIGAMNMVASMQDVGAGRALGNWQKSPLATIIDSVHFVDSARSPGVQLADKVAFMRHRSQLSTQGHPDADAAVRRIAEAIGAATRTWREAWPPKQ